jgi:hypothetical protein
VNSAGQRRLSTRVPEFEQQPPYSMHSIVLFEPYTRVIIRS